ncbi:carotenoid oxygenase family protein [Sciscionella marina]|uniref:carotenoid oxygenase family protein n=1 Tax=Sciscionella marina TaxID=508770 RepID=UPI0003A15A1C|nr:carotenoid oxygenase family protein [Sciscionella marina]
MTESLEAVGHLAPVPDEIEAFELEVAGALPPELCGRYLRNGPNPLLGEDPGHWFAGHGMLHGIRLRAGRAEWYRNRWVCTDKLAGRSGWHDGMRDLRVNSANTHVIEHGGALLALCEGGLPYQVTDQLDTVGAYDFGGRLRTAMTAHPKEDPVTGELLFYGYSSHQPYLTFHIADADGTLVHSEPIEVPGPTMMHDFAITENHVLWLDLPMVFDQQRPGMPFGWDDHYGARIGVMPRTGGPVRWVDIEPCYVFHVGNASEDSSGAIVLDAVRYRPEDIVTLWHGPTMRGREVTEAGKAMLHRWRIDPRTGTVQEQQLDDRAVEFPTLSDALIGRASRYLYLVAGSGIAKHDNRTGEIREYRGTPGDHFGEPVFVPAAGARAEDEGWLLTITTPADGSASALLVLDASDPANGPVARVRLPRRVPAGFHGSWIED